MHELEKDVTCCLLKEGETQGCLWKFFNLGQMSRIISRNLIPPLFLLNKPHKSLCLELLWLCKPYILFGN